MSGHKNKSLYEKEISMTFFSVFRKFSWSICHTNTALNIFISMKVTLKHLISFIFHLRVKVY